MLLGAFSLSRGATAQCASHAAVVQMPFTPAPAPSEVIVNVSRASHYRARNRPLHTWQVARVLEQHNLYREQHGACPMTYSTALEDHVIDELNGFQTTCDTDIPPLGLTTIQCLWREHCHR